MDSKLYTLKQLIELKHHIELEIPPPSLEEVFDFFVHPYEKNVKLSKLTLGEIRVSVRLLSDDSPELLFMDRNGKDMHIEGINSSTGLAFPDSLAGMIDLLIDCSQHPENLGASVTRRKM